MKWRKLLIYLLRRKKIRKERKKFFKYILRYEISVSLFINCCIFKFFLSHPFFFSSFIIDVLFIIKETSSFTIFYVYKIFNLWRSTPSTIPYAHHHCSQRRKSQQLNSDLLTISFLKSHTFPTQSTILLRISLNMNFVETLLAKNLKHKQRLLSIFIIEDIAAFLQKLKKIARWCFRR